MESKEFSLVEKVKNLDYKKYVYPAIASLYAMWLFDKQDKLVFDDKKKLLAFTILYGPIMKFSPSNLPSHKALKNEKYMNSRLYT